MPYGRFWASENQIYSAFWLACPLEQTTELAWKEAAMIIKFLWTLYILGLLYVSRSSMLILLHSCRKGLSDLHAHRVSTVLRSVIHSRSISFQTSPKHWRLSFSTKTMTNTIYVLSLRIPNYWYDEKRKDTSPHFYDLPRCRVDSCPPKFSSHATGHIKLIAFLCLPSALDSACIGCQVFFVEVIM